MVTSRIASGGWREGRDFGWDGQPERLLLAFPLPSSPSAPGANGDEVEASETVFHLCKVRF